MFDFWYELPTVLRALMGLGMILIAVLIYFFTGGHLYAYGMLAVGFVFLLFCDAGNSSGGYKF